jgi:hypothetical protein
MLLASPPPATPPPASFPQWGDVPTWGLFVFAAVTAVFAYLAFRKQSQEVRTLKQEQKDQQRLIAAQTPVLELQAQDLEQSLVERRQDREQRQRDQASRVFMLERWGPLVHGDGQADAGTGESLGTSVTVEVHNTSSQPIYDLRITWQLSDAPYAQWAALAPLMPGDVDVWNERLPPDATREMFGAVIYFRDAAQVIWRRQPDGQLALVPPDQEPRPGTW